MRSLQMSLRNIDSIVCTCYNGMNLIYCNHGLAAWHSCTCMRAIDKGVITHADPLRTEPYGTNNRS